MISSENKLIKQNLEISNVDIKNQNSQLVIHLKKYLLLQERVIIFQKIMLY